MSDEQPDDEGETDRYIDIESTDPLSLDEALSIIGEETRANIIIELGEARTTDPTAPNSLGFSELMKRVGTDGSGRFNHHRDKLVGTFVKNTEAVDVEGTNKLLDSAADAGISNFVHISIVGIEDIPYSYYEHKLTAERAVETATCHRLFSGRPSSTRSFTTCSGW